MKKIPLYAIAHGRSGDKGDGSNVGVLAYDDSSYALLREQLTPERVRRHFDGIVLGEVERYELPNLRALNFILHDSLGGGGSSSLKTDAQGKTHAMALLRMEIEVPDDFRPPRVGADGAVAPEGELEGGRSVSELRWVKIDGDESGVRALVLDKPPVNALGRELVDDLTVALGRLARDEQARCLIVRSGAAHFCAGADLKERATMGLDEVRRFVPRLAGVCNALAAIPYPTIAEVRGAAAGGGCELALACDLRVLADGAKIGLRETALAIIPGAGGTQRLPRLIGPMKAKRWIFGARMHTAAEAFADGVADRVVPDHRLGREVQEMAESIAACGPVANRLAKRAIDAGGDRPLPDALQLEWECYLETLDTEDRVEALRAFGEKRTPRFEGR